MPEIIWTKKRRGTAGLTGRSTRVPPKEYWPGVGEVELGFDDSGRNKTGDVGRTLSVSDCQPDKNKIKNKNGSNGGAHGAKTGRANYQKQRKMPRKGIRRSMAVSLFPWNTVGDPDTPPPPSHRPKKTEHRPKTLIEAEPHEIRSLSKARSNAHMRRRSPKRPKQMLAALAPHNNKPENLDTDRGRNCRSAVKEEPQQQQPQRLPQSRQASSRPKRMLASLFPYNTVGNKPSDLDTGGGRKPRAGTKEGLEPHEPASPIPQPKKKRRRLNRMLASLAPHNSVGREGADIDLDTDGRRNRRSSGIKKQAEPAPRQPRRPKRARPVSVSVSIQKESAVDVPQPDKPRRRLNRMLASLAPHNAFGKRDMFANYDLGLNTDVARPKRARQS